MVKKGGSMTVPALDVLRNVRWRWTDDIGWPLDPEYDLELHEQSAKALADLNALVQRVPTVVVLLEGSHGMNGAPGRRPHSEKDRGLCSVCIAVDGAKTALARVQEKETA
jgi:hypothetical protein